MKKNKIFISLKNYTTPNTTANYGVQLAKRLERPAHLFGVEKVPVQAQPISITGSGMPNPTLAGIGQVHKIAEKQLKELSSKLANVLEFCIGRTIRNPA